MKNTLQTKNGYDSDINPIIHVTPDGGLIVSGTFAFTPVEVLQLYLDNNVFLEKVRKIQEYKKDKREIERWQKQL
jgi:hypothetical protein